MCLREEAFVTNIITVVGVPKRARGELHQRHLEKDLDWSTHSGLVVHTGGIADVPSHWTGAQHYL